MEADNWNKKYYDLRAQIEEMEYELQTGKRIDL